MQVSAAPDFPEKLAAELDCYLLLLLFLQFESVRSRASHSMRPWRSASASDILISTHADLEKIERAVRLAF